MRRFFNENCSYTMNTPTYNTSSVYKLQGSKTSVTDRGIYFFSHGWLVGWLVGVQLFLKIRTRFIFVPNPKNRKSEPHLIGNRLYVCMYRAPKWKLYNDNNNIYYVLQYNWVSQNSVARAGSEQLFSHRRCLRCEPKAGAATHPRLK